MTRLWVILTAALRPEPPLRTFLMIGNAPIAAHPKTPSNEYRKTAIIYLIQNQKGMTHERISKFDPDR
jgi:hypothetical protein